VAAHIECAQIADHELLETLIHTHVLKPWARCGAPTPVIGSHLTSP
jgi:hypothetical protein